MSARVKSGFIWIWMISLVSASVGISVHRIYCYCTGKAAYSFFRAQSDPRAAVMRKKHACCKGKSPKCSASKTPSCSKENCTKKSVEHFQLKVQYLIGHPLEKSFDLPMWAGEMPEYMKLFRQVVCQATLNNKAPPGNPGPPLSGRIICLRHEIFRC